MAGGADIIDAKEPTLGPLAPVSPGALQSICAAVPPAMPFSVALGDARPRELSGIVMAVAPLRPRTELYFKVALLSASPSDAAGAIATTAELLATRLDRPALIVARYVDEPGDADDLASWVEVCAASGARGLLLDTSRKDGGNLLASMDIQSLVALRRCATRHGVWLALAGGITLDHLDLLGEIRPHVVGVRGAACDGLRSGALSRARVTLLSCVMKQVMRRQEPQAFPA